MKHPQKRVTAHSTAKITQRILKMYKKNNTYKTDFKGYNMNDINTENNTALTKGNTATTVDEITIKSLYSDNKVQDNIIATAKEKKTLNYSQLIKLIRKDVKAKKESVHFKNYTNKQLFTLLKFKYDSKDSLTLHTVYLYEKNITLPFGLNKAQIGKCYSYHKKGFISSSQLKNKSVELIENLIEITAEKIEKINFHKKAEKRGYFYPKNNTSTKEDYTDVIFDTELITA